ncbi:MAG TPA: rhodanese-like domain-containing protein [Gaiellaceae bacterium]
MSSVPELPSVVDAAWLQAHLGEPDLVVGDVRGPNAHMRGHIPGSRPLVLGSPMPTSDPDAQREFAREIQLRLRRHGITGEERLVLYDRGDGVGAMPAAQLAELAGHPRVAILLGGLAGWTGELEEGAVELEPVRQTSLEPRLDAIPTREELAGRLHDDALTILDVRRPGEYRGKEGSACDPRQGHIPGARHLEVGELFEGVGMPRRPDEIRSLVGLPDGSEIVAYCHSGSRSALATLALRSAGYRARNYAGSWHEWSRHPELPVER